MTEWCVHVLGPDDVIPATDRQDAMRQAHELNAGLMTYIETFSDPLYPSIWAIPARVADVLGYVDSPSRRP